MEDQPYKNVEEVSLVSVSAELYSSAKPELAAFQKDVMLRLEQTGKASAIRYLFEDKEEAERYRAAIMRYACKYLGPSKVHSRLRPTDGGWYIYFWHRSENKK